MRGRVFSRIRPSARMFTLLVKQGGIRYEVTPGGQKVYDPHEIDRYMAERQGKPIPEGSSCSMCVTVRGTSFA